MIEAFVKDARFAIRGLQQPAFTFVVVMALALGIGATTTMFSVIQNVLLPNPTHQCVTPRAAAPRRTYATSSRSGLIGKPLFQRSLLDRALANC
jgi:hypothetical protein